MTALLTSIGVTVLVLLGAALLFFFARKIIKALRSSSWPSIPGQITANAVVFHNDGETCYYEPQIKYSYSIRGQVFSGNNIALGRSFSSRLAFPCRRVARRYPVGKRIPVYYNPRTPSECVLIPGVWPIFSKLGFIFAILLMPVAFSIFALLKAYPH